MDKQNPAPGVYRDTSWACYVESSAANNSWLRRLERSPAHYRHHSTHDREDTTAFKFGRLVHCGVLEPDTLARRYVVRPDFTELVTLKDGTKPANPRATKQYRELVAEFNSQNAGREILDPAEWEEMEAVCAAVQREAGDLFKSGAAEVVVVWDDAETGMRCKARLDWVDWERKRIVDLKTTRDAAEFEQSLGRYRYDRQAAFYLDGLRACGYEVEEFWFCCVESSAPYGVRAAPCCEQTIKHGRARYREARQLLAECRKKNKWPGYSSPTHWRLPTWARNGLYLETDGVEKVLERKAAQ